MEQKVGFRKAFVVVVASLLTMSAFAVADETGVAYYQVEKNDTLSKIARRHGTTVAKLCELNGRTVGSPGWDRIQVGMRLCVPHNKVQGWLTDEEAVALYANFLAKGLCEPQYEEKWVLFIDAEFDGVLEAVVGTIGGTACCSTTEMYHIDKVARRVKRLGYDEGREEGDMFGYTWDDKIRLLKDKNKGTMAYFLGGYVRDSSQYNSMVNGTGLAIFTNGTVKVMDVSAIHQERDETHEDTYHSTFTFMGKTVSEQTFKEKEREFLAHYENIPLRLGLCKLQGAGYRVRINGQEAFSLDMTKKDLHRGLLACYRAFSYDLPPRIKVGQKQKH